MSKQIVKGEIKMTTLKELKKQREEIDKLKEGLVVGLFAGLVFGLFFGLVYGLVAGLVAGLVTQIIALINSNPEFSLINMILQLSLLLIIQIVGWYYVNKLNNKLK